MIEATAPTSIGYCGESPAKMPPQKQSRAEPRTRTEWETPNIRPCASDGAVSDSSADMLVVANAMEAPTQGRIRHSHHQSFGRISRISSPDNATAQTAVIARGVLPPLLTGFTKSHCVITIEMLVYERSHPTWEDVNSHFWTK